MNRSHTQHESVTAAPPRGGALLLELVAATALFGVVLAIAVPVIASVTAIRQQSHRRQCAQLELANVMERIAAGHRAGDSLDASIEGIELSPEMAALIPEAKLTVDIVAVDDLLGNRRVTARLEWTSGSGQPAAPAELTAFFVDHAAEEAAP